MKFILSTCFKIFQVCGSYQCPYCPFYSSVGLPSPNWAVLAAGLIATVAFQNAAVALSVLQRRTFQVISRTTSS